MGRRCNEPTIGQSPVLMLAIAVLAVISVVVRETLTPVSVPFAIWSTVTVSFAIFTIIPCYLCFEPVEFPAQRAQLCNWDMDKSLMYR